MSRPKNAPIGEVECPQKGCTTKCQVFRFRQRTDGRQRFAGKLYCECPVHGRYGADGKQASQEYILENGTIWGASESAEKSGAAPDPIVPAAPAAPVSSSQGSPSPASSQKADRWAPIID